MPAAFLTRKDYDEMLELNKIYNEDCLEGMKRIPDCSVDMILCDLPYQETGNKWDKVLNLTEVFQEYERIIKEDGAIVLTGTFKFGVLLYNAAPHLYKYDWVWEKDNGTNAPNVNYQPFRVHENIYVFGKGRVTNGNRTPMKYFPQKTDGKPYTQKSGRMSDNWKGGLGQFVTENLDGSRHPKTIQKVNRDRCCLHPTQKPVALFEYLIKTYTNEGETVLDNCIGSGTTAIACINTNRNYIGFELDKHYCDIANERIQKARMEA